MSPNMRAFLGMIAYSEIGPKLLANPASDRGYSVLVGGGIFSGYTDHPRQLVWLPSLKLYSTAAGRYQLLARYFDAYRRQLRLTDFSPASQDAIAVQQIRECQAVPLIELGRFDDAVARVARIWASLPGAGYGQHENQVAGLRQAYVDAGGALV